ncbi:cuticle protein AM1159-like [Portunus trituberculatus]|uniref:cuticle protein AM1159-like n=1 Tax=Portunus trituberculatus TaxID=210409 RepID=UPI001E1CD071|nr:cuticle protein AM1159-like [Portunus trituberculatus]
MWVAPLPTPSETHRPLLNNTMKLVLLACLVAAAAAAPQNIIDGGFVDSFEPQPIVILRDERQDNGDGNFNYLFEASNGIQEERTGTPGIFGQSNMQGTYRFTLPDGTVAEVRYIADENGYRAESPLIPTPHPLPAHAIEQIRIAEEQREQGITFEPQPFEQ